MGHFFRLSSQLSRGSCRGEGGTLTPLWKSASALQTEVIIMSHSTARSPGEMVRACQHWSVFSARAWTCGRMLCTIQ